MRSYMKCNSLECLLPSTVHKDVAFTILHPNLIQPRGDFINEVRSSGKPLLGSTLWATLVGTFECSELTLERTSYFETTLGSAQLKDLDSVKTNEAAV